MVEFPSRAVERENFSLSESRPRDHLRCLKKRMGGGMWIAEDTGVVERDRKDLAHKCSGAPSSEFCSEKFLEGPGSSSCTFEDRQLDYSGSYKQDGRYKILVDLTKTLFDYALSKQITVTAEHMAGVLNVEANQESRVYKDWINWRLNPQIFRSLSRVWGPFEIDLFGDRLNCQMDRFISWKPDPAAEAVDAFQVSWRYLEGYAFPPFSMIGRCLAKVAQDQATLVMLAPTWNTEHGDSESDSVASTAGYVELDADGEASSGGERVPRTSGMEHFRKRAAATCLSKNAASLVIGAWRGGTQSAYNSSWTKWVGWCGQRQIDLFDAIVADVVFFCLGCSM